MIDGRVRLQPLFQATINKNIMLGMLVIMASADESIGSSGKVLLVAALVFREKHIHEVGVRLVDVKREFGLPVEAEIHTSDIAHGKG